MALHTESSDTGSVRRDRSAPVPSLAGVHIRPRGSGTNPFPREAPTHPPTKEARRRIVDMPNVLPMCWTMQGYPAAFANIASNGRERRNTALSARGRRGRRWPLSTVVPRNWDLPLVAARVSRPHGKSRRSGWHPTAWIAKARGCEKQGAGKWAPTAKRQLLHIGHAKELCTQGSRELNCTLQSAQHPPTLAPPAQT